MISEFVTTLKNAAEQKADRSHSKRVNIGGALYYDGAKMLSNQELNALAVSASDKSLQQGNRLQMRQNAGLYREAMKHNNRKNKKKISDKSWQKQKVLNSLNCSKQNQQRRNDSSYGYNSGTVRRFKRLESNGPNDFFAFETSSSTDTTNNNNNNNNYNHNIDSWTEDSVWKHIFQTREEFEAHLQVESRLEKERQQDSWAHKLKGQTQHLSQYSNRAQLQRMNSNTKGTFYNLYLAFFEFVITFCFLFGFVAYYFFLLKQLLCLILFVRYLSNASQLNKANYEYNLQY